MTITRMQPITLHEGMFGPGIYGFFGDYRWLSNFEPSLININDRLFKSVEHYYQASKSRDRVIFDMIADAETPNQAKRMGQSLKKGGIIPPEAFDPDWEIVPYSSSVANKDRVMMKGLQAKYRIPFYREKLDALKGLYLEETNWWNDTYWGVCENEGLNKLGKFTMMIRDNVESYGLTDDQS